MLSALRWMPVGIAVGFLVACGGNQPLPASPEPIEEVEPAPVSEDDLDEPGHDLDVGMHFEGQEDEPEPESEGDHAPPPTKTYQPPSRIPGEKSDEAQPPAKSE